MSYERNPDIVCTQTSFERWVMGNDPFFVFNFAIFEIKSDESSAPNSKILINETHAKHESSRSLINLIKKMLSWKISIKAFQHPTQLCMSFSSFSFTPLLVEQKNNAINNLQYQLSKTSRLRITNVSIFAAPKLWQRLKAFYVFFPLFFSVVRHFSTRESQAPHRHYHVSLFFIQQAKQWN